MGEVNDISERRTLRKNYRNLKENIQTNISSISELPSEQFSEFREENNSLFAQVDNIRELGIDANVLSTLALAAKNQAIKLSDVSSSFDFKSFAISLKRQYCDEDNNYFDWAKFGQDIGKFFVATPKWSVMNGPMAKEIKVRKIAERRKKEDIAEIEEPDKMENKNDREPENEATNERLKALKSILAKIETEREEDEPKLPIMELLVNTADPVQTIENLFDMSFLIKSKELVIQQHETTGELYPVTVEPSSWTNEDKTQMVLSLNMKEIKQIGKYLSMNRSHPNDVSPATSIESCSSSTSTSSSVLVHGEHTTDNNITSQSLSHGNKRKWNTTIHRQDDIYHAKNAHEQAEILDKRKEKLFKKNKANSVK